jgi:hypothetical protein
MWLVRKSYWTPLYKKVFHLQICNSLLIHKGHNPWHTLYTVCFTDLGKLNLTMVVDFKLKPIFATAPAASKNEACFKSGQN